MGTTGKYRSIAAVLVLLAASGCSDIFGGGRAPSSFKAALSFSQGTEEAYEGKGEFYTGHSAVGVELRFTVQSESGTGDAWQNFYIHRRGDAIRSPGTYALTALDMSDQNAKGLTALYFRKVGGAVEYYRAQSGELRVSGASRDRIEATFRFKGYRYCVIRPGGEQDGPCLPVGEPPAGAPTIEVVGSFSAVPLDDSDIEEASAIERIPR